MGGRRNMKTIRYLLLTIFFLCAGQLSHAADKNGNYVMGGGVGGVKCSQFVASMEKGRSFGIGSYEYVIETYGFQMYLLGFQTGYNMGAPETYDIFYGYESTNELLARIENFCRIIPDVTFGFAVTSLGKKLHPKRKKNEIMK